MNREEFIKSEIKNEPDNPLNYYLLAVEYRHLNNNQELEKVMEFMLDRFENYLPIYYFYAEHLFQMNEIEKAIKISEQGIILAQSFNNYKLVNELKQQILLNN